MKSQTDATIDSNWGNGSPQNLDGTTMSSVGPDNFSVRWPGQVQGVEVDSYTFSTTDSTTDVGVRLWIGTTSGTPLIYKWVGQGPTPWAEAIALALHQAGHHVSLVNPALIRAFAHSQLLHTKTDKADAHLIARFCQMHRQPRWTPPPPEIQALQALVRRLETLLEMHTMEPNRLGAGLNCAPVQADLAEHLSDLQARIEKVLVRSKTISTSILSCATKPNS